MLAPSSLMLKVMEREACCAARRLEFGRRSGTSSDSSSERKVGARCASIGGARRRETVRR